MATSHPILTTHCTTTTHDLIIVYKKMRCNGPFTSFSLFTCYLPLPLKAGIRTSKRTAPSLTSITTAPLLSANTGATSTMSTYGKETTKARRHPAQTLCDTSDGQREGFEKHSHVFVPPSNAPPPSDWDDKFTPYHGSIFQGTSNFRAGHRTPYLHQNVEQWPPSMAAAPRADRMRSQIMRSACLGSDRCTAAMSDALLPLPSFTSSRKSGKER